MKTNLRSIEIKTGKEKESQKSRQMGVLVQAKETVLEKDRSTSKAVGPRRTWHWQRNVSNGTHGIKSVLETKERNLNFCLEMNGKPRVRGDRAKM